MKTDKLKVYSNSGDYCVYIGKNASSDAPSAIKETCGGKKAAIVSDTNVFPLYGEKISSSLRSVGYEVFTFVLPAGEGSKSFEKLLEILSFLSQNGFDRHDVVVTLGGGVVGDIGGLAASLYMRGTNLVHFPTSLLAMVDSCVGGKTAVNTGFGKNTVGTFYPPRLVFCDTSFLDTLPEKEYACGMAEVIKYGVISDAKLFEKLKKGTFEIENIISDCLRIKKALVGADEHDNGIRKLLNFGHTFGHAVEKASSYAFTHGEAVAVGMVAAAKIAEKISVCEKGVTESIVSVLSAYSLPTKCGINTDALVSVCLADKKSDGDEISLVLPEKIGNCVIRNVKKSELKGLVECI